MSDPIEEPDVTDETSGLNPDADPENLNPRDERDAEDAGVAEGTRARKADRRAHTGELLK